MVLNCGSPLDNSGMHQVETKQTNKQKPKKKKKQDNGDDCQTLNILKAMELFFKLSKFHVIKIRVQ